MARYKVSRQIRDVACSVKLATWENGFRCLHQKTKFGNFIVQLYMLNGSEHFPYGWSGLPHLCEHVATTNVLGVSQREFARRIDQLGESSFDTGSESVFFGCETDRRRWKRTVRFFFETLQACRKGLIDESALESHKKVIRHEISNEDSLQSRASRAFYAHVWPQNSGGQSVLGTTAQLRKFSAAHVIDYFQESVVGKRLVLGVSGAINSAEVFPVLDGLFGRLPAGEEPCAIQDPKRFGHGIVLKAYENEKRTEFVMGQSPRKKRRPRGRYNDDFVKQVVVKILGGLHSSEPYIAASVNGQSYEIEADLGSGSLKFYGSCDIKDLNDIVENCMSHLWSLARNGPERTIFDRARSALILDETYFAHRPRTRLHYACSNVIDDGTCPTYRSNCREIMKVRPEHVKDYIQRLIGWNKFTLVVAGRLNGWKPSARIKRWCGVE
jgi:predicted Zn-dependent peptidase